MIGYYVHHEGSGHLHRAVTVAPHLPGPVTGISSLPRPDAWTGPWLQLARDDAASSYAEADVSAAGRLHWVPTGDQGLRKRMAAIAAWIERHAPAATDPASSCLGASSGRRRGRFRSYRPRQGL